MSNESDPVCALCSQPKSKHFHDRAIHCIGTGGLFTEAQPQGELCSSCPFRHGFTVEQVQGDGASIGPWEPGLCHMNDTAELRGLVGRLIDQIDAMIVAGEAVCPGYDMTEDQGHGGTQANFIRAMNAAQQTLATARATAKGDAS